MIDILKNNNLNNKIIIFKFKNKNNIFLYKK